MLINILACNIKLTLFNVAIGVGLPAPLQYITLKVAFLNESISMDHRALAVTQPIPALAVIVWLLAVKLTVALGERKVAWVGLQRVRRGLRVQMADAKAH